MTPPPPSTTTMTRAVRIVSITLLTLVLVAWIVILSPSYDASGGGNQCEMSFMYPRFEALRDVRLASPTHALYAYTDARDARTPTGASRCASVSLFIPGTGGSYKQARSVGSATYELERGEDNDNLIECRVEHYALDFGNEMSIYNGALMDRQGKSVVMAVRGIQKAYAESKTSIRGWTFAAHSAGGLAVMRALSDLALGVGEEYIDGGISSGSIGSAGATVGEYTVVALATPAAWNPVSLTFDAKARELEAKRRWKKASGASDGNSGAFISIIGGPRDRQVGTMALGALDAYVSDANRAFVTRADLASNVGVSADHQCALWCKQLVRAVARGVVDSMDGERSASERVDAFRSALGDSMIERQTAPPFGVSRRVYETVQERTLGVLAGVGAHGVQSPSPLRCLVFALVSASVSPVGGFLESFSASIVVYVASIAVADALIVFSRRFAPLETTCVLAHTPSLIAWAHHAITTATRRRDVVANVRHVLLPFGIVDALSAFFFAVSLRRSAPSDSKKKKKKHNDAVVNGGFERVCAFIICAVASAPGNLGFIHVANVIFHVNRQTFYVVNHKKKTH
jgi:glycosylphosphatidylinositol deacylase